MFPFSIGHHATSSADQIEALHRAPPGLETERGPYTMLANTFVMEYTQWERKYHVIFIPKYRRKVLYGTLRRHLSRFERFRWMPPALPGE